MDIVQTILAAFKVWRDFIGPLLSAFGVNPGSQLEEAAYAAIEPIFAEATQAALQYGLDKPLYALMVPYVVRASAKLRELGLSEVTM